MCGLPRHPAPVALILPLAAAAATAAERRNYGAPSSVQYGALLNVAVRAAAAVFVAVAVVRVIAFCCLLISLHLPCSSHHQARFLSSSRAALNQFDNPSTTFSISGLELATSSGQSPGADDVYLFFLIQPFFHLS